MPLAHYCTVTTVPWRVMEWDFLCWCFLFLRLEECVDRQRTLVDDAESNHLRYVVDLKIR